MKICQQGFKMCETTLTYGTGCFAYTKGACECYTLTIDEWLFENHIFLLRLIVTLFLHLIDC